MKALTLTLYDSELISGETMSLIVGTIIIILGIVACTWASSYQEHIIKSISQTFI